MELHRLRPAELRQLADRRVAHSVRVLLGRRPLSAPRAPSTHAVSWCCGRDYSCAQLYAVSMPTGAAGFPANVHESAAVSQLYADEWAAVGQLYMSTATSSSGDGAGLAAAALGGTVYRTQ